MVGSLFLTACAGLVALMLIAAGALVYWAEPEQKILAGLLAGMGILLFVCIGLFYLLALTLSVQ